MSISVVGETQLALSAIRIDGGTQPRASLDLPYIADLAQAIQDEATLPPVIVFYDGAEYWLADGFHRYHATQEVGREHIDADVRQGTRRDAVLYSVGANAQHGLRRTNADKQRSVETLLNDPEWAIWSNREIARRCAVDEGTVRRYRDELSAEVPQLTRKVERNGSEYTIVVPPSPKFPPGWCLVDGKKFDMPLPDGKPLEIPESWKFSATHGTIAEPIVDEGRGQIVGWIRDAVYPVEIDRSSHDGYPLPVINRGVPPALQMSESNEWYTPAPYVDAARELMGEIDVDPASNEYANSQVVRASTYYDIQTNGLEHEWTGRVFLNPPYGFDSGRSNQEIWTQRLIAQYNAGITTEAVLLVNANTEAKWFQPLYEYLLCFTHHRIRFYNGMGESSQPTQGNALVYLGKQEARFIALFKQFGVIVRRADR